jgi:hypothetical protein
VNGAALAAAESLDQQAAADYIELPCSDRRLILQLAGVQPGSPPRL